MTHFRSAIAFAVLSTATAHASLTLLPAGPMLGTHAGNLVTNGSFENPSGGPGPLLVNWATGSTGTPFAVPPGWSSSGSPNSYAVWGRDGVSSFRIRNSDVIPDGGNALYFGNGQGAIPSLPPTFNPSGEVTFPGTPTISTAPGFPNPVKLWQTVNTHLAPASSYILSFWVSGESSGFPGPGGMSDGIFGFKATNTEVGDPTRYFVVPAGGTSTFGASKRFEFTFTPLNPSLPVMLEFTNFGHFSLNGGTTELVLDDVIINPVPAPSVGALGALTLALAARRRR